MTDTPSAHEPQPVPTSTGERRFRLYFRLMDFSTLAFVVLLVSFALQAISGSENHMPPGLPGLALFIFFLIGTLIVPIFLIVARRMRDDYAEGLWRRTAMVLTYMMAIVPLCVIIAAWAFYGVTMQLQGSDELYKTVFGPLFDRQRGNVLLTMFLGCYLMAFVLVFQFLRWRDSR